MTIYALCLVTFFLVAIGPAVVSSFKESRGLTQRQWIELVVGRYL